MVSAHYSTPGVLTGFAIVTYSRVSCKIWVTAWIIPHIVRRIFSIHRLGSVGSSQSVNGWTNLGLAV